MITHKPTIGLLGGCGPHATLDIENKLILATRSLYPIADQHYYPMMVYYGTQLPDRSLSDLCEKQLKKDIDRLYQFGVNILLIACQSAHKFINDVQSLSNLVFINMIDATVVHVTSNYPQWKTIGLLGTEILCQSGLYQKKFKEYGVEVFLLTPKLQKEVMCAIYTLKAYGINFFEPYKKLNINDKKYRNLNPHQTHLKNTNYLPNPVKQIITAIDYFKSQGLEGVILGCTELPLLLPYLENLQGITLIDSNQLSAEKTISCAYKMELTNVE